MIGPVLKVEILSPELELLLNEREVVLEAALAVKDRLVRRLRFGLGSTGPLPHPKDGGRPLLRTGRLLASIDVGLYQRGTEGWNAVVRPFLDRPDKEVRVARSARRTEGRQAALALGLFFTALGGGAVPAKHVRKKPTKDGQVFKGLKVKASRSGITNAAVAAILSQPPVDQAARKGGRAVYRVFERSAEYDKIIKDVVDARLMVRIVGKRAAA